MEVPYDVLVVGYVDERVVQHVNLLSSLREKGLVDKVRVLSSRVLSSTAPRYKDLGCNSHFVREFPESGKHDNGAFHRYVSDILGIVGENHPDIVIPTTDMAVAAVAEASKHSCFTSIPSTPDYSVVELFQNKSLTYDYFSDTGIWRVPNSRAFSIGEAGSPSDKPLLDVSPPYFAKPSVPQSGGAVGTGIVSNSSDLQSLMLSNPQYGDYLVSEFLNGPEVNHTFVLNNDGSVATECAYEFVSDRAGSKLRRSVYYPALRHFSSSLGSSVRDHFRGLNIRGVYNADFLRDTNGDLVLSEVNPGRFPVCMGVFNFGDYNPLEPLVRSLTGEKVSYGPSYQIGREIEIPC